MESCQSIKRLKDKKQKNPISVFISGAGVEETVLEKIKDDARNQNQVKISQNGN
jgi:RNA-binding protein YhbY